MNDGFESYSHADCKDIAPDIQWGLEHIGRPWNKLFKKNLTIYRDETNLSATPDIWGTVEGAVLDSGHFVLLASPMAAASKWVRKEVDVWIGKEQAETGKRYLRKLFIVVCKGTIAWGENDFDWAATNCLPPNLAGQFEKEPLWIDLRSNKGRRHFEENIAKVIGGILHKDPVEIVSQELYRLRQITTVIVVVTLSFIALSILAFVLYGRESEERRQVGLEKDRVVAAQQATQAQRDTAIRNLRNFKLAKFVSDLNNGKRLYEAEEYIVAQRFFRSADTISNDTTCSSDERILSNRASLKTYLLNSEKLGGVAK